MHWPSSGTGHPILHRYSWYQRLHARLIAHGYKKYEEAVHPYKQRLLRELKGTVIEIGPGAGANLPYFSPEVRWIGLEPNPYFYRYLREQAAAAGLPANLVQGQAERLPFADGSADAVVSTLVLCTVRNPRGVLCEIRRILRPGGKLIFLEHVRDQAPRAVLQRAIRPLWSALADGCHPDRDTAGAIQRARFSQVHVETLQAPLPIVGPHIAGWAVR